MKEQGIRQYIPEDVCLHCQGCCRYSENPSIWSANLLPQEKEALNLDRPRLIASKQSYLCAFLNPENNHCRIYEERPFECRLYPFLLNNCCGKISLSLDLACPYTGSRIDSKEFKDYLEYLVRYIHTPSVLTILEKSRKVFPSYPAEQVVVLAELRI